VDPNKYTYKKGINVDADKLLNDLQSEMEDELNGGSKLKKRRNRKMKQQLDKIFKAKSELLQHALNNKHKYYPFEIPYPPLKETHPSHAINDHQTNGLRYLNNIPEPEPEHKPLPIEGKKYSHEGDKASQYVNQQQHHVDPIPDPEHNFNNDESPPEVRDGGKPENRMSNESGNTTSTVFNLMVKTTRFNKNNGMENIPGKMVEHMGMNTKDIMNQWIKTKEFEDKLNDTKNQEIEKAMKTNPFLNRMSSKVSVTTPSTSVLKVTTSTVSPSTASLLANTRMAMMMSSRQPMIINPNEISRTNTNT